MRDENHFTKQRQNLKLLTHALEYLERGIALLKQAQEREAKLMRNHDEKRAEETRKKMVDEMKDWGGYGI